MMTPAQLNLPIGIQSFREIREGGYYYVDKTPFALQLWSRGGKAYFLSRPRRFGKSLFLDTLHELFAGRQELFTGLYAEERWDWSVQYPVVHFSFGAGVIRDVGHLTRVIHQQLKQHERRYGLPLSSLEDVDLRFGELLEQLHEQTGQRVVVLVDEYDKPILDSLEEPERATELREGLRNLYSVIKDKGAHIRFAFLTGVSKFSKVSLFSGLNNLEDITLVPQYSAICGYTDTDIDTVFAPELEGQGRFKVVVRACMVAGTVRGSRCLRPMSR